MKQVVLPLARANITRLKKSEYGSKGHAAVSVSFTVFQLATVFAAWKDVIGRASNVPLQCNVLKLSLQFNDPLLLT